ncbi:MAG: mannonate dehydratase [Rhizobiaceae bacterium]
MRQGWRWYGPDSGISLDAIRQAGASDIVTALHHVPIGEAWTAAEVAERKSLIEDTPHGRTQFVWSVVESIPVDDAIKRKGAEAASEIDCWIASMKAVAENGIGIICYNFMPVVDWTRTDLDYETQTGSTAMRFDQDRFAVFDLHILQRPDADEEYSGAERDRAKALYESMSEAQIEALTRNIASALPGSTTEPLTIGEFREKLDLYAGIDARRLRSNFVDFLKAVTPVAEELGVKLALHPDDPPRSLFGLPRIVSTGEDYHALFEAVPSPSNGMCFCTGSLGVRADNDLVAIARKFAARIHFAHLRATKREGDGKSFHESAHLEGDVDMVAVIRELLKEEQKRNPDEKIVFRPDHGQRMLSDFDEDSAPGYPAIGRLRGLAELRGIMTALEAGED